MTNTYTAEQTAENRKTWTNALRSGEFIQGSDALRVTSPNGESFCCWGVACELAVDAGILERTEGGYSIGPADDPFDQGTLLPPKSVVAWVGLADQYGTLIEHVGHNTVLTEVNDSGDYSFEEIADTIDAGNVYLAEVAA